MNFSFLAIVFVFGILVVIHELGHYLAAKWMGVRVERFSIGFPPRLFGKKIGDKCVTIFNGIDTKHFSPNEDSNSKTVKSRACGLRHYALIISK